MKINELTKDYLANVLRDDLRSKLVGEKDFDGKIIVDVEVDIYTSSWDDGCCGGDDEVIKIYLVTETAKRKLKSRSPVYL